MAYKGTPAAKPCNAAIFGPSVARFQGFLGPLAGQNKPEQAQNTLKPLFLASQLCQDHFRKSPFSPDGRV